MATEFIDIVEVHESLDRRRRLELAAYLQQVATSLLDERLRIGLNIASDYFRMTADTAQRND